MKNYTTVNGTNYYEGTPTEVINIIESVGRNKRLRFWYGTNGKSWNEENDVCGYIGRSTGEVKIPLLINKSSSFGGGALMTDSIVKIVDTKSKRVLYQHPNFFQSLFTVSGLSVLQDGGTFAPNYKNIQSAQRLADFMNGKRMSK